MPLFLELLRSETAASPARMAAALAGMRRYQSAPRTPPPAAPPAIASAGRAVLRDYGGAGPPLLVVPSLINPPHVLDLAEDRSLLRWLGRQSVRPLLVDWQTPAPAERALDLAGHIETMLLPLIEAIGEPPLMLGYCLGGTLALAAAARAEIKALALLATPWNFDGFPDEHRAAIADLWTAAEPVCDALGLLPMEVLQSGFWRLDPARTVAKFEDYGTLAADDPKAAAFVTLEDWANDGPPLPYSTARELFDDLFDANLPGRGRWQVGGRPVDLAAIETPVLNVTSGVDRIVPAASAPALGERLSLDLGHVGMVVGSRARKALWEPLAAWLNSHHLA